MRGTLILCVCLIWGGWIAPAQEIDRPDSNTVIIATSQVTINADIDSAIVFIDSVRVGLTPLTVRDLKPGFHHLKIVHPDVTNWLTNSILDSIQIQPGQERTLRYTLGRRFLLLSVPSGAEVIVDDSLQGTTPFLLSMGESGSNPSIKLRKAGYDSATVDLTDAQRGTKTVALKAVWSPEQRSDDVLDIDGAQKPGTFRVYLAGAVTVGFGAAAAYFKIQADNKNQQYLEDFSSASRSQIHVYDTASGICLAFAEIGFGFLTYYLLAE
jgi:hypothetical protein